MIIFLRYSRIVQREGSHFIRGLWGTLEAAAQGRTFSSANVWKWHRKLGTKSSS